MECTGLKLFVLKFYVVLGGLVRQSDFDVCVFQFLNGIYVISYIMYKVKAPKIHIAQAESGLLHPGAKY